MLTPYDASLRKLTIENPKFVVNAGMNVTVNNFYI